MIPGWCRWCSDRLWAEQCDIRILAKLRYFSVFQNVLTGSGAHPPLHSVGKRKRKCKGKGKVHPRTGHEVQEVEQMYSSTFPLTSALDGVGGERHAPTSLPPPPGESSGTYCIGG
jgi:hypothetical protein